MLRLGFKNDNREGEGHLAHHMSTSRGLRQRVYGQHPFSGRPEGYAAVGLSPPGLSAAIHGV